MEYCKRCDRYFTSPTALSQHIRDSARHAVCHRCDADFSSQSSLNKHFRDSPHHHVCKPCGLDFLEERDLDGHDEDVHYRCLVCWGHFGSPSNLRHHRMTHAEKEVECFGCTRRFISTAAMILHLETGTCESGADRDIVGEAARGHRDLMSDNPDYEFQCPRCDGQFRFMSGVLQHFESDTCKDCRGPCYPISEYLQELESELQYMY